MAGNHEFDEFDGSYDPGNYSGNIERISVSCHGHNYVGRTLPSSSSLSDTAVTHDDDTGVYSDDQEEFEKVHLEIKKRRNSENF